MGSFRLGRLLGVDVSIHWSWLFIFFLVTWSFAEGVLKEFFEDWTAGQRWLAGAIIAAVFFSSILAHELSHALMSRRLGLPVHGITLFVFGGVAHLTREAESARDEFLIAIVGPATSLAAAAFFGLGWLLLKEPWPGIGGVSGQLAVINAVIAAFNLLPGFPLDGGRVFRSVVWWRNRNRLAATRTAARAGEIVAYLIMAAGVIQLFSGYLIGGMWFILIGIFLRGASAASYEQLVIETTLSGISVGDVMQRQFDVVPPDASLQSVVDDYVLARHARCFVVLVNGELAGLLTLTDIRNVPRSDWPLTSVWRAMTPVERIVTLAPTDTVAKALMLMSERDINQIPVVWNREVVGMIHRADVMRLIQIRRVMAEEPGAPRSGESEATPARTPGRGA